MCFISGGCVTAADCSNHGTCTSNACVCDAGRRGNNCEEGMYNVHYMSDLLPYTKRRLTNVKRQ